jgi:hypothetical protein
MRVMFVKWLKLRRKSEPESEPEPQAKSEPQVERLRRPITSMMVPEPGAIIGGKRRRK